MRLKCSNCGDIFEADENQEWKVKRVIDGKLLDVSLTCDLCGENFVINPEKIFDYRVEYAKKLRKERKSDIILDDNKIKIGPHKDELFQAKRYYVTALSLMRINDIVVSKTNTITNFEVTFINTNGKRTEVRIKITNSVIDYGLEELNKYQNVFKKINSPKDDLLLEVDNQGSLMNVINSGEIKQRWMTVRRELEGDKIFGQFNNSDRRKILDAADDEYYNLDNFLKVINKGYSVYAILFAGFWGIYTLKEPKSLFPIKKQSMLFKDTDVYIEFEAKLKRFDPELLTAQVELQGIESDSFDVKTLAGIYKEAFPFAKNPLEKYKYDILANYEFDAFKGSIDTLNLSVIEEAGDVEMFMDCKLKTIHDEKSHFAE